MDLGKLNTALFAQLDRLAQQEQSEEQLKAEIERCKAISNIARDIISNAKLALEVTTTKAEYGISARMPDMLLIKNDPVK